MSASLQPNILFITADQFRADCLSAMNHPVVETPHLDQLAAEGVLFQSAYSDCPVCVPARCSIISGLHASTYGKTHNFPQPFPIERKQTLMSLLTQSGYQTQAVGKMHFNPVRSCYGFENMILDWDYVEWLNEKTSNKSLAFVGNGIGLNEFWPAPSPVPANMTSTAWTVDESIRFLRHRDPDRPFFLWTSFFDPHPPIHPPEPYYSMYDHYPIEEPAIGDWVDDAPYEQRLHREMNKYDKIAPQTIRKIRSSYYGTITYIDHQLGRLFGAMRAMRMLDNTLIVFTSDHGEYLGDHRDFGKVMLHNASSKVPLLLRWPKDYCPERVGARCEQPVGLVDILPTLVEFGGGIVPVNIDGRSLLPLAKGEEVTWREYFPCEVKSFQKRVFALTTGKEKYIWYEWGNREQYFELIGDPKECYDLSQSPEFAERIEYWRNKLIERLVQRGDAATDGNQLIGCYEPYPSDNQVRSKNPHGWNYDRPNM